MSIKINDDKPANEDRLGRTNFVNNLYNLITNSEDILKENSLTIDINGKWGDGKTTVINLLKKKFKDDNDNSKYRFINFLKKIFRKKIKYKFIDFNAWEYSNKTDLTGVLIDTLNYETSGIIKKKLNSLKNGSVSFYNKFAIYSNIFFISIFIIFWLLFVIKNIFDINYTWVEEWCFIISYIFSIYSLIKYVYFLIKNKINNLFSENLLKKIKIEKNITDIKEEAKDILSKQDKTFIVVIDDFDRLNKEEVCKLISFVKSNLDLPKFIFIFLYDREIINKILLREYEDPKFLEKIVNCQLDLPQIRQEYLEKFLEEEIEKIFKLQDIIYKYNYYKLTELYPYYFTNMRKVKRFLNQLSTDYRMLTNADIDNIDFLFIEIVKHFEYKLYKFIRDNKEKFLGTSIEYAFPKYEEKIKEFKTNFLKEIKQNTKNGKIIDVMKYIFPRIFIENIYEIYRCLDRINNINSFYKYFQLDNNIEEITKSEYNDLKQSFNNIDNFIDNLEKLADQKINNAKTLNKDINLGNVVYSFKQCFLDDVDFFAYGVNFVYDTTNKELLIKIYCILMICDIYGNKNHNDFYLENYNEIFKILNKEKYLIYITHSLEYYLSILKSTMEDNICIQNYVDNLPKFINNIFKYFIDIDFNYKKNDYKYINSLEKLLSNLFYFKDLNNLLLKQGIIENIVKIFNKFKEFMHRNEINKNIVRILIKLLINCVKSNQTIKNDLFYIIKHNNTLFEKSEIEKELKDNNLLEEFNNYNIN